MKIFRGMSKLCIYTKHSLLMINLKEQQAYEFVQFSDFAKNSHLCTPIIVNIFVALCSLQKLSKCEESSFKNSLNVCSKKNNQSDMQPELKT